MAKKKELFKRKDPNCTSFYLVICGEHLEKVNARNEINLQQIGKKLKPEAVVKQLILGI